MYKILIAESVDERILEEFQTNKNFEFTYFPNIAVDEIPREIAGYDGLFVRPKQVTDAAIRAADKLKLVIRGGAGVNTIALEVCKERGIIVANTPGLNSDATAEFTFALIMNLMKQVMRSDIALKTGENPRPEDYMGFELKGKRLGIIGYGNIGKRVERIANAFGMEVSIFKRGLNLHEFLKQGHDIITLHIPLSHETKNFIGTEEFKLLQPGTILINTARPQLVEAEAFHKALAEGTLGSFGIDGDYDLVEPFFSEQGIITHHIADATYEAQANITHQALTQFVQFFEEGLEVNRVV